MTSSERPREDVDTVVFRMVGAHKIRPRLLVAYLGLTIGLALVGAVIWWAAVDLPGYVVQRDGSAVTTQKGLTEIFGGDAWYSLIGLIAGLVLGVVGWIWFGRSGWVVVPIAVIAGALAAAGCWWTGWLLGPGPLNPRLVAAQAGDFVPIELTVRAPVCMLVWILGAVVPIVARASLGPDPEDVGPRTPRDRRRPKR